MPPPSSPSSPVKSPAKSGVSSQAIVLGFLLVVWYFNNNQGTSFDKSTRQDRHSSKYIPSRLEQRIMEVSKSELHYDEKMARECDLFRDNTTKFYADYHKYLGKLDRFEHETRLFRINVEDLRLLSAGKRKKICRKMDKVLHGSYRNARKLLSSTHAGFVEPLLPPLRHPRLCQKGKRWTKVYSIEYLVHDFGTMCRRLGPNTRTVFFDLGASLEFHGGVANPALSLIKLYNKFGIKFDHYYAFEYSFIQPQQVYKTVPEELLTAYHWYNVPVEASPTSKQNPWKSILSQFTPEDLVVVKLDIDTSSIEIPLAHQLMDEKYARLVDHLYFEHHVFMREMHKQWRSTANGTLQDSLELFTSLREAGIGAHSWV